jgi:hypothetical protein
MEINSTNNYLNQSPGRSNNNTFELKKIIKVFLY